MKTAKNIDQFEAKCGVNLITFFCLQGSMRLLEPHQQLEQLWFDLPPLHIFQLEYVILPLKQPRTMKNGSLSNCSDSHSVLLQVYNHELIISLNLKHLSDLSRLEEIKLLKT